MLGDDPVLKGIKTSLSIKNKTQRQQIKTSVWGKDKNKTKMSRKKKNQASFPPTSQYCFSFKGNTQIPTKPRPFEAKGPAQKSEPTRRQGRTERTGGNYPAFACPLPASPQASFDFCSKIHGFLRILFYC